MTATGAFSSVEAQRTAQVEVAGDANALLALDVADSNNGAAYAEMNGDTIEIQVGSESPGASGEGVNPNAITTIDNIFTITNQGSQSVTVTIYDGNDQVTFYAGSHDNPVEDGIDLPTGETLSIGITVDTTDGTGSGSLIEDATITAVSDDSSRQPEGEASSEG